MVISPASTALQHCVLSSGGMEDFVVVVFLLSFFIQHLVLICAGQKRNSSYSGTSVLVGNLSENNR